MTYNEENKNEISCADNTLARSQQNEEEMQEIVNNMEAQSVSEEELELDDRHCPTCECDKSYSPKHCPNCKAQVFCLDCGQEV